MEIKVKFWTRECDNKSIVDILVKYNDVNATFRYSKWRKINRIGLLFLIIKSILKIYKYEKIGFKR